MVVLPCMPRPLVEGIEDDAPCATDRDRAPDANVDISRHCPQSDALRLSTSALPHAQYALRVSEHTGLAMLED